MGGFWPMGPKDGVFQVWSTREPMVTFLGLKNPSSPHGPFFGTRCIRWLILVLVLVQYFSTCRVFYAIIQAQFCIFFRLMHSEISNMLKHKTSIDILRIKHSLNINRSSLYYAQSIYPWLIIPFIIYPCVLCLAQGL